MCTQFLLLKISMVGVQLNLVKYIPMTFKNSDFILGRPFGISRSVRLQKIIGNQQYEWDLYTILEVKLATKLRQRRKIQSTSSYKSSGLDTCTLI